MIEKRTFTTVLFFVTLFACSQKELNVTENSTVQDTIDARLRACFLQYLDVIQNTDHYGTNVSFLFKFTTNNPRCSFKTGTKERIAQGYVDSTLSIVPYSCFLDLKGGTGMLKIEGYRIAVLDTSRIGLAFYNESFLESFSIDSLICTKSRYVSIRSFRIKNQKLYELHKAIGDGPYGNCGDSE